MAFCLNICVQVLIKSFKKNPMKIKLLVITLFVSLSLWSQDQTENSKELSITEWIDGTLLTPKEMTNATPLAIIIAGSGPTNRDGNQNFLMNNSLKKLAEGLFEHGIATFRYDKRIVKQIRKNKVDSNIMFDDFVFDATAVIDYFRNEGQFSKIYVIGHSQGSLVGMLACKGKVDGFISLAGAGHSIDTVIIDQIAKTAPMYTEDSKRIFSELRQNKTTTDYPPALSTIFDISIQPFMSNWMKYNPQEVIKDLDIPILIINGTKDLQVSVEEANRLKAASVKSEIHIIENMNHILFTIEGDDLENSKSYNEGYRDINEQALQYLVEFIN